VRRENWFLLFKAHDQNILPEDGSEPGPAGTVSLLGGAFLMLVSARYITEIPVY
jgi:hypothetical protein